MDKHPIPSQDKTVIIRRASLAIRLATEHCNSDSARLCLADAIALVNKNDYENATQRAVKSLAYSVGIFHPDYKRAKGD